MNARPIRFRSLRFHLAALAAAILAMMAPATSIATGATSAKRTATAPDHPAARTAAGVRSGEGWRSAPPPAWVEPHAAAVGAPGAIGPLAARGGWHALLIDEQRAIDRNEGSGQYLMWRALITDASGLGSAGRVEVSFDPSYQKVLLHAFAVWRDGRRLDRLADARIEPLRREAGLENESIDGRKTLLVILNDVRVGDIIEVSYSILGQNPVHGPSHDGELSIGFDMPVDRLFASVTSRSTRRLHVRGVRTDAIPAVQDVGGVQRWQLERADVAAIQPEEGTPSDYAVYPRVDYSDDADWREVADWGMKLFDVDSTLGPDLEHRLDAWRASGLKGQALVSAALSLVQDDVRYFSASLGENSHRPKVPARTWADRAGDCKDKTALLVAILQRLGFDAKPALVSSSGRNSLHGWLPGHDVFDHAIVRLQLDGRTWWLDGTMMSQATRLDTRALPAVDWALVVAPETQALEVVKAPAVEGDLVTYDHVWDTSDISKPARLQVTVTTRGDAAEGYRATIASGRLTELVEAITAHYRTRFQDYRQVGEPVVHDDRAENRLSVRIEGEVPLLGDLRDGALSVEIFPLRIVDSLVTPDQLRRSMPWAYEPPQTMSERIRLILPQPPHLETPLRREVSDPHFSLTLSSSESGHERILDWHFQRRDDAVLPADLAHFRDRITKARNDNDILLTEPLVANDRVVAKTKEDGQKMDKDPRVSRDDELSRQVARAYARRVRDDLVLAASGTTSQIGRRILIDRALQDTLLGEDDAAEADLGQVAADAFTEPTAQYTRGLVLFTSGHFADAEKAFRAGVDVTNPVAGPARRWVGVAAYFDGRLADAVRSLREASQDESGDERTITLAWLFLAAQHQDQHGEAAIAPFLSGAKVEDGAWSTKLLNAMREFVEATAKGEATAADWDSSPTARALLATIKNEPGKQRERAVQMMYFLPQLDTKPGDRGAVVAMLQLEGKIRATSMPEDIYARTELRRVGMKAPAELVDSARKAAAAGDRRGAAKILQRAVAVAPDDTDALLMLGRLETDQLNCEGLEPLTRAASLRTNDPVIGIEFARVLAPCGTPARAAEMEMLARWLADPRTPPAARAEGLALRSMMRVDEDDDAQFASSEDDAKAALGTDAGLPIASEAMFHVHRHRHEYQKALEDADRMRTAGAPPQQVALYRGMALGDLQRDDEAEAELTSSLAVEPDNWIALKTRAEVRLRRHDAEGAVQDSLAWTRLRPERHESWESLKNAQMSAKHSALARDALDHHIALQPDDAALRKERAKLDVDLGDHKTALADFDKALEIDKSDAANWIGRANELWRLKRDTEAVASCLKGLELLDTPLNRSACAVVEWETGDHARAIETLDTLPSHRKDMEAANEVYWFIQVGEALMSYGRAKEAVPFIRRSLDNRPDWPYGPLLLYLARALSGDEAGGRAELAARSVKHPQPWPGHLVDYAAGRLDDDALRKLATVDAPGDFAGQVCEATFYMGLRHWLESDVTAGRALLVRAANECPRTFVEAQFARAWLAAGPGLARDASTTSEPTAVAR